MTESIKNTFKKKEILSKKKEIANLFLSKQKFRSYPFFVILEQIEEQDFQSKILISIPKKRLKKATDRNLIKRRSKEAFRKNKNLLYEYLYINNKKIRFALIYSSSNRLDYQTIEKQICEILKKIVEICENANSVVVSSTN